MGNWLHALLPVKATQGMPTLEDHMTLIGDIGEYTRWLWRATKRLVQVDRRAALRLILSMSINQFVTVIVFLLPLKIVLLIASDGVPKYFQFFITSETKSPWLVGLATTIFILYVVSLRLDSVASRSAGEGAESLVTTAQQVPVTSDPSDFAGTTFYRIGSTVGALVFSIVALLGGIALFPAFFVAIPILLAIDVAAAGLLHRSRESSPLSRAGYYLREHPKEFLKSVQDISFLVVFALLLVYFLVFEELNPLLGMAAIMLSRRIFGALKSVAQEGIKFSKERELVDAILFADVQIRGTTLKDCEQLLGHAPPSARLANLQTLALTPGSSSTVERYTEDAGTLALLQSVEKQVWVDSGNRRKAVFDLYGPDIDGQYQRLFRDYAHSGRASRGLEQHDYVLRTLGAERLRCPPRVLSYRYDGVVGRLVDFRGFTEAGLNDWRRRRQEMLEHLWSLELPASLVAAYHKAHPRFEERIHGEILESLRLAADEHWAQSTYDLVVSNLSQLCDFVSALPLMLFNERLTKGNVVVGPDGRACVLDWTSWTLQPVGTGFAPDSDTRGLLDAAIDSMSARASVPRDEVTNAVLVVSLLQRMERLVQDGYPKTALGVAFRMAPIIEHPNGPPRDLDEFIVSGAEAPV